MKQVVDIVNYSFTKFCFIKVHIQLVLSLHIKRNSHSTAKYQQYYQALCLCTKCRYEVNIGSFPDT